MHRVHRYRETDSGVFPDAARNRRVHPDHAPLRVEERAPRVAGVDRRVRLNHALNAAELLRTVDRAIQIRNDPLRHRAFEPEGVPDRVDGLPDEEARRIPKDDRHELLFRRVDLQDRDIRVRVDRERLRGVRLAVVEGNFDGGGVFDDVEVRQDDPFLIQDDAASAPFRDLRGEKGVHLFGRRHVDDALVALKVELGGGAFLGAQFGEARRKLILGRRGLLRQRREGLA